MGPAVLAGLQARAWLAEHSDEEVLARAWRTGPDIHVETHTMPGPSDPRAILLRQGGGLRRQLLLTTVTAAYVSVCDGELTAAQAAAAISGLLDLDGTDVAAEIAAFTRAAARDGLLR
jgi:hypothetical protein